MITGVSWWGHKVDNAYWIWNFQGKILKKATVDKFCQLTWRPRPPTLLSKEQLKDVKKNLKKYSDQFIAKDKMRLSKASKELVAKRQAMMEEYTTYRLVFFFLLCSSFSKFLKVFGYDRSPTSYKRESCFLIFLICQLLQGQEDQGVRRPPGQEARAPRRRGS